MGSGGAELMSTFALQQARSAPPMPTEIGGSSTSLRSLGMTALELLPATFLSSLWDAASLPKTNFPDSKPMRVERGFERGVQLAAGASGRLLPTMVVWRARSRARR